MKALKETKVTLNIPMKRQKNDIYYSCCPKTVNDDALFYRPCHFFTNHVTQYHKMKPEGDVEGNKLSHLYGEYYLPK